MLGSADRRVVSYDYDVAGRQASVSAPATGYAAGAGVTVNAYAAHGAPAQQTYGNGLVHSVSYNSRVQPSEIKLGTSGSPASLPHLTYDYGSINNNGDVLGVSYAGGGIAYAQTFSYDPVDRLEAAQETSGGVIWTQTNGFDRYGNRWVSNGGPSLAFDPNSNRIVGRPYDAAGNLLGDGVRTYSYDAENRLSAINGSVAYRYDGDGRRVRKLVGESVRFVYGLSGRLIAEVDGASGALKKEYIYGPQGLLATTEPGGGTKYVTADHLGSPRLVTNAAGAVVSRHDFMPFGEELLAGMGSRTAGAGYGAAGGPRQKFTGYQRDDETGLDYAHARYYSGAQGRFTSADPYNIILEAQAARSVDAGRANAKLINYLNFPQEWNRFAYAGNSPLRYVDPDGMRMVVRGSQARRFISDLMALTGLNLEIDGRGEVQVVGDVDRPKLNPEAQQILDIIRDPNNTLFVAAIDSSTGGVQEARLNVFVGQAGNVRGSVIIDYADVDKFERDSKGTTPLTVAYHEAVEAWTRLTNPNAGDLESAHKIAIKAENVYRARVGLPPRGAEGPFTAVVLEDGVLLIEQAR